MRRHVTRRHDRDVDEGHELGRQGVVCLPGVHLNCGSRMEGQRRGARLDEPRPEVETRSRAVLEASSQLHRHRDVDGLGHRFDDPWGKLAILEQRRPGAGPRHLPHRAAEVEVDDVGAYRLDHACGVGHRARVRAEELDRQRMLVGGDSQVAERSLVPMLDSGAADHLRADQPGPVASPLTPEGLHAHPGHGREDEACGHLDGSDVPRRSQVHLHRGDVSCALLTRVDGRRYHCEPFDGACGPRHPVSGLSFWSSFLGVVREGCDPDSCRVRAPEA